MLAISLVGCGSTSADSKRLELEATSWDVQLLTTAMKMPEQMTADCGEFPLSLRIEEGPEGPSLLLGRDGRALRAALRATALGYELAGPAKLPATGTCLELELSKLSLRGIDTDGDAVPDTLSGNGDGTGTSGGEARYTHSVAISLGGARDATPPEILPSPSELYPLYGVRLNVSEPLRPGATLALEGTSPLTLTPESDDQVGAITTFSSDEILPFGGTWTTVASASDFAEHALTARSELRTVADPGFFAEDGFEGALAATPAAAVRLVEGIGVLPAISGQRSLWVTAQLVMLHLQRTAGQTKLRARAQWFYRTEQVAPTPKIFVGVVGSSTRISTEGEGEPPAVLSEDPTYPHASQVSEITLPLEGDGAEVIVAIYGPWSCGLYPFCSQYGAVLLDDLRLE